jgi:hypothetical protein
VDFKAMFDGQRLPFTIKPTDAKGNPAPIETGSLEVSFSDEDNTNAVGLTATLNDDGVSGFIHSPAGSSGKSIATFSGDADLGAGVSTITYSLEIEVTHRMATNLGVGVGDAEDEPAAQS